MVVSKRSSNRGEQCGSNMMLQYFGGKSSTSKNIYYFSILLPGSRGGSDSALLQNNIRHIFDAWNSL